MGNYLWKTGLKVTHFRARSVAILRPGALMSYMNLYELWISFNLNQFKPCGLHEAEKLAVLQVLMECHRPHRPHDLDGAWWCSGTQMYSTLPRMPYQNSIKITKSTLHVFIAVYCKCIRPIWWTLSLTWTTGVQIFKTSCSGLAFANSLDILLFWKHILDSAVLNFLSDIVRCCKITDFSNL